jgi:AcrR family transcriptional regulator
VEQAKSKRAAQAEATREHLLETARAVFSERGFHNTSVGAITSAADTAHGTFYLYFRNKEDAFAAVVQSVVLDMYDTMTFDRPEARGRDCLDRALRNLLKTYVKHAGIWRCLLEAVFISPAIETMWREMRAGFVTQMAKTIVTYQDKGTVRVIDPLIAANAIAAMFEWTATTSFVLRMPPVDDVDFDATVEVLVDLCYHALSTSVLAAPDPK